MKARKRNKHTFNKLSVKLIIIKLVKVTENFTIFQQKQIKEWSENAKERNAKEKVRIVWRARGDPSRRLYIKEVEKKTRTKFLLTLYNYIEF